MPFTQTPPNVPKKGSSVRHRRGGPLLLTRPEDRIAFVTTNLSFSFIKYRKNIS